MIDRKKLSNRIRNLRESRNLSINDLAKELNLSKATVGHWETGLRLPSLEVTDALADYFDVSTDYLLGRTDKRDILK